MMNNSDILFTTEYVVKVGEKYYFVASEMNVICAIDLTTEKIEVVGSIPEEETFAERLCIKIVFWKGQLFFIPMNGRKVWIFYLAEERWHSIPLKHENIQKKIRQAFIYKDRLFMIGCHYPAIICIDLHTEETQYIYAPYKEVQNIYEKANGVGYFRHDCVLREHLLYFASFITNKVLIFNLNDFSWKYVTVGSSENGYSGIAWDGRYFWLSPCGVLSIVRWDGEGLCTEYPLPYQESNWGLMFIGVVFGNKDIFFPAVNAEYTLVLHNANIEDYELKRERYLFYEVCDSGEIVYGKTTGEIVIILENGEKHSIKCNVSISKLSERLHVSSASEEYKRFFRIKFSDIMYENDNFSLNDLLDYADVVN